MAGDKRRSARSQDLLIGFALMGLTAAVVVMLLVVSFAGAWPFG